MENLKHTEGEWVANPHGENKHQVWCNKTKVAACDNSIQSEIYRKKSEAEMEANSRLIAAAPQLLEALIKGFNLADKLTMPTESELNAFKTKAQEAINKALGE